MIDLVDRRARGQTNVPDQRPAWRQERRQGQAPGRATLGLLARRKHGRRSVAAVQYGNLQRRGAFDTRRPRGRSGRHTHSESVVIRRTIILAAALAALLGRRWPAQSATEVAGVKYEGAVQIGNGKLLLNGAGIRYKAIFKVYTAGLYLAPGRHHRSGAGDARRQAHAHRDAARHRRQRTRQAVHARHGTTPQGGVLQVDRRHHPPEPSCSRPRRSWPPASPSRSTTCPARHHGADQRQGLDRADQGARVLRVAAEDLAQPRAGRRAAEGRAARQGAGAARPFNN